MKQNHAQSLVYICIGIESKLNELKGKTIYYKEYNGGYEFGDGRPGGMMDTTYWVMTCALPILKKVAKGSNIGMIGSEWLYNVCEGYGGDIIEYINRNGMWPDDEWLERLAMGAVDRLVVEE